MQQKQQWLCSGSEGYIRDACSIFQVKGNISTVSLKTVTYKPTKFRNSAAFSAARCQRTIRGRSGNLIVVNAGNLGGEPEVTETNINMTKRIIGVCKKQQQQQQNTARSQKCICKRNALLTRMKLMFKSKLKLKNASKGSFIKLKKIRKSTTKQKETNKTRLFPQ